MPAPTKKGRSRLRAARTPASSDDTIVPTVPAVPAMPWAVDERPGGDPRAMIV